MNSVVCFPKDYRQKDYIKATHFEAVGNMTLKNCEKLVSFCVTCHCLYLSKIMHIDTQFTKDHLKIFMLIFVNMNLSVKELYI